MNLDTYQPHSAPRGAPEQPAGDSDTIGFHPTAFDLDHILLEVQHGAILKMHSTPPKSGKDLMSEVRKVHGSKEKAHLKKAQVTSIQALLSEIREHKILHSLKHMSCKSCHQLMSEIRSTRGGDLMMQIRAPMRMKRLSKTTMKSQQDLMTMLRQNDHMDKLRNSRNKTMARQDLLSQVRAERGGKTLLKPYKSIMKQVECPHTLKKANTTAKQSLLSQVRAEHGIYDSLRLLKHMKSPTKSPKNLMSEVRSMHGGKTMSLRKSFTMERQSLLSQVRMTRMA